MDTPNDLQLLQSLDTEISRRSLRSTNVEVLEYKPSSVIPASQLAPTGTIAVYVSRRGSPLLKEIREAARDNRDGRDRKLVRRIMRQIAQKTPVPMAEATRRIATQPVIAHLCYGGATMVPFLFSESDRDLYVTVLPYAGGPLIENGFRLDEYLYEDDDEPLECVLVKNPPILTAAESAALKKVPPAMRHMYVSPLDMHACGPAAAAALYVLVWGAVAATFTLVKGHWDESMEHINPQAIDSLGPVATVRAMLRLRMDILKGQTAGAEAKQI